MLLTVTKVGQVLVHERGNLSISPSFSSPTLSSISASKQKMAFPIIEMSPKKRLPVNEWVFFYASSKSISLQWPIKTGRIRDCPAVLSFVGTALIIRTLRSTGRSVSTSRAISP